jgi:hypothetical protein
VTTKTLRRTLLAIWAIFMPTQLVPGPSKAWELGYMAFYIVTMSLFFFWVVQGDFVFRIRLEEDFKEAIGWEPRYHTTSSGTAYMGDEDEYYQWIPRTMVTEEVGNIGVKVTKDQAGFHVEWRGTVDWMPRSKHATFTFYDENTALDAYFILLRNAIYSLGQVRSQDITYDPYIMTTLNRVEVMSEKARKRIAKENSDWALSRTQDAT